MDNVRIKANENILWTIIGVLRGARGGVTAIPAAARVAAVIARDREGRRTEGVVELQLMPLYAGSVEVLVLSL